MLTNCKQGVNIVFHKYSLTVLRHTNAMDLSPLTQREQKHEQPQQVSSHSLSAQHTNSSPLIVSIPRLIREQHITETATRFSVDTPSQLIVSIPYPIIARRNTPSKEINSLTRERLSTGKKCQPPSFPLQSASCSDTPPAKRVYHYSPQQLAGSSRQYESDDSDSTCIQQYESVRSQQCDGERSETNDDQHFITSSVKQN